MITITQMREALCLLNSNAVEGYWFLVQQTENNLTFNRVSTDTRDGWDESRLLNTVVIVFADHMGIHEMDMNDHITGTATITTYETKVFLAIQELNWPDFEVFEFSKDFLVK